MNVTLPDLDEHVSLEKRIVRRLSATLRLCFAIDDLEVSAKDVGLDATAIETVNKERDRLKQIVALYGRG